MNKPLFVSFILGTLMVSAGGMTIFVTPTVQISAQPDKINLDTMIPREFAWWKTDPATTATMVNADSQGLLDKIYNQTYSSTYINNQGERVMLSIAYGRDQNTDLHVHRPEICYMASGFNVGNITKTFVDTTMGQIPVMRLVATQGSRNEPITYWIRVGDSLTRGWFEQKLTAIGYGLTGKIPDGLLFRVSTISNDENDSFRIQQQFLSDLLQAMHQEDRHWLVGQLAQESTVVMTDIKN